MKLSWIVVALVCGCGSSPKPALEPISAPAASPLVGDFQRQDPEAPTVLRFSKDGTCAVGGSIADLAAPSHRCTWTLDGKRLTFTNIAGACADADATKVGVFDVEVTDASVSFKMIDDKCDRRMSIDGQTWLRVKP